LGRQESGGEEVENPDTYTNMKCSLKILSWIKELVLLKSTKELEISGI
jgi:hypothetical protein